MTTTVAERPESENSEIGDAQVRGEKPVFGCPKCGSNDDWGTCSWCPSCGYYPGITDEYAAPEEPKCDEEEETETTTERSSIIPVWGQWTMGLCAAIVIISTLASNYFYYQGGDRGLWAFIQLVLGIVLLVSAQISATIFAMKESDDVSITDCLVSPIDVWRHTYEKLPREGNRIARAVVGATLAVTSVAIIGGIDFESFFDTPIVAEREEQEGVVKRAMTAAFANEGEDPEEDMEESLNKLADQVIDPSQLDMELPSDDEPLDCFIYGYMADGKRDFGRLLLGAQISGRTVHVGEIAARDLPPQVRQNLAVLLPSLASEAPAVESPFRGSWVKPTQSLSIEFDGWTVGGKLVDPRVAPPETSDDNR